MLRSRPNREDDRRGARRRLHIISEGLTLWADKSDPYEKALFQMLGEHTDLEAMIAQQRARAGVAIRHANPQYYHGLAPLAFEKDDGHLVLAENRDRVVQALKMVQKENLSKRKAAKELNTSRRTINRSLERAELYGL